jgi:hypothetical protein
MPGFPSSQCLPVLKELPGRMLAPASAVLPASALVVVLKGFL